MTTKERRRLISQRVELLNGCWVFTGGLTSEGYGQFRTDDGKNVHVHRYWLKSVRRVPSDKVCDHACRNRACFNPEHIRLVTNRENILAGVGPTAVNAKKTQCANGHALSGDNLYVRPNGHRRCKECGRQRCREYRKREAGIISRPERGKAVKVL